MIRSVLSFCFGSRWNSSQRLQLFERVSTDGQLCLKIVKGVKRT